MANKQRVYPGSSYAREARDEQSKGKYGGYTWNYWTGGWKYKKAGRSSQNKDASLPPGLVDLDDGLRDTLQTNVFRWGQMPIDYAMNELGLEELDFDNTEQLEELNNYMMENFPDIYQQGDGEVEEEYVPYEPTVWEPKELEIEGYTPPETKSLQTSKLTIGKSPMPVSQLQIKGTAGFKNE